MAYVLKDAQMALLNTQGVCGGVWVSLKVMAEKLPIFPNLLYPAAERWTVDCEIPWEGGEKTLPTTEWSSTESRTVFSIAAFYLCHVRE